MQKKVIEYVRGGMSFFLNFQFNKFSRKYLAMLKISNQVKSQATIMSVKMTYTYAAD